MRMATWGIVNTAILMQSRSDYRRVASVSACLASDSLSRSLEESRGTIWQSTRDICTSC